MKESHADIIDFDFEALLPADRYRLLTNFVVPRPIALVSTRSTEGQNNAAPMSFFNVLSHDPPIIILGIQSRPDGCEKDTMTNIRRTGEFAVNMVDRTIANEMIICGANFNSGVDEFAVSGLTSVFGSKVNVPLALESPCTMECRVERIIDYPRRAIILGEVLSMHVRRSCLDKNVHYVNPEEYQPIARMHADNYILSGEQFSLRKPVALEGDDIPNPAGRVDSAKDLTNSNSATQSTSKACI